VHYLCDDAYSCISDEANASPAKVSKNGEGSRHHICHLFFAATYIYAVVLFQPKFTT